MQRTVWRGLRRRIACAAIGTTAALSVLGAPPALASSSGRLAIVTHGLPQGIHPSIVVRGRGVHRRLDTTHATLDLRTGRYTLEFSRAHVTHSSNPVRAGATGYPSHRLVRVTVHAHRTVRAEAAYSIVNPTTRALPRRIAKVIGNRMDPDAIVLRRGMSGPPVGTILASGPRAALPAGLLSRVTGVSRQGDAITARLVPADIADAVPQLSFSGELPLSLAPNARDDVTANEARVRAHTSSGCTPPKLLSYGAHLDQVSVREAFLGAWPPQMRLTLAARTTEHLGVALAAVGINCDWDLGQIGPFQGAIPVGPIVVPVYATFPIKAGIHVNGTLNVGTFNIASTTVARVAAGFNESSATLKEEGSNVWISGGPSISGSAKLSASIGLQAGVGVAKGANVHVEADFGPVFTWHSGARCKIDVNLGALSAGISVFGKNLNSPPFAPFAWHLWDGCSPATAGGGGGGGAPGNGDNPGAGGGTPGSGDPSGGGPGGGAGSVTASNNDGQMTVQLSAFPLGTTYYFCHSGTPSDYPTGGTVTGHGQITVTSPDQTFTSGLCSGRSNAWIGLQATDNHDYYSNQVDLQQPATPGASVSSSNNNGQMAVQFTGFPQGTTYYFCHSGNPSDYPTGGVITGHGQITISSPNQSYASGLCSGRGNAWIGIQAADNHDYYSNQVDLYAPPTPGANTAVFGNGGQMSLQVSGFPQGTTYYFCHAGDPSQYPTGGSIIGHGQINVSAPDQTFGPLCSGAGNAWIGVQATDGHDYYSNQITL
jgi:hypothetical protein